MSRHSSSISGLAICADPGLVVEAAAQGAHHDGQPIAVVALSRNTKPAVAQSFQDSVDGGARQADFVRDLRDRRAVAQIEHRQRIKTAHERADWAC